jgi:hypothetical protein
MPIQEFASVSVVKNFHFKTKLMEEHFNESYAETAKYPKATFTGKILISLNYPHLLRNIQFREN